jgi:hypothetical protein
MYPKTCGVQIPPRYFDPILYQVMVDPVVMPDGITYDRTSIARVLAADPKSPVTRQPMSMQQAVPNQFAKELIEEFLCQQISVTVKYPDSSEARVMHVPVSLIDTLRDLKTKIVSLTGIPVADQILLHNGAELADEDEPFYESPFVEAVSLELRRRGSQDDSHLTCGIPTPLAYLDPVTYEIMSDPVLMPDGHTYDRKSIARCLANSPTSPVTRQPMSMEQAVPNRFAKELIDQFLARTISVSVNCSSSNGPRVLRVSVCLKDKIRDLKAKIVPLTGVPVSAQILVYNAEELTDDEEQFYQGTFVEQVSLDLHCQRTNVFVKALGGNAKSVSFYGHETLLDFKNRVQVLIGIPVREQRMRFAGKELDDDNELMKSLAKRLRITADKTIHIIARLRG